MTVQPDLETPREQPAATTRVDWAPVPQVNLLPPEVLQARRGARFKRLAAGAVGATVVVCALLVVWAQLGVSGSQDRLDAVRRQGDVLRGQQARYAQVPVVLGLIDSAETAREQAMARDVLWYGLLGDLSTTTPRGVTLDSLEVKLDGPSTQTDPLLPAGIGSVTFTGKAAHFPDVAAWLDAVGTLHGLNGSTLASATRAADGAAGAGAGGGAGTAGNPVSFSSTVQISSQALTHRYDRKAD